MFRPQLLLGTALLFALGTCSSAAASLIVTVGDLQIAQGQRGFVDVTIRSDLSAALASFGVRFRLDPSGGLQFSNPPSESQLGDPSYLFHGNSFAELVGGFGLVSGPNNEFYDGADLTLLGDNLVVPSMDRLLVRLELEAGPAALLEDFRLELDTNVSSFQNALGEDVPLDLTNSRLSGTVTVLPGSRPVPEPATLVIWCLLGLAVVANSGFRRRGSRWRVSGSGSEQAL